MILAVWQISVVCLGAAVYTVNQSINLILRPCSQPGRLIGRHVFMYIYRHKNMKISCGRTMQST